MAGMTAIDKDGNRCSVSLGSAIGSGGVGTVYADASDSGYALKLYEKPEKASALRPKLETMVHNPPSWMRTTSGGTEYIQLAWPTDLVEAHDGRFIGIRMPYLASEKSDDVEFLLRPHTRREHNLDDRFEFRIVAACNLAALVDKLHVSGYCMPDLKPTNVRIYRDSAVLTVFDCDGMGVLGKNGRRFLVGEATPQYMAPEAHGDPETAGSLGVAQDRFALAVTIFELLNEGLHPYQGVPRVSGTVPNDNQRRIDAGLYPHGRSPIAALAPNVQSLHPWFQDETIDLFDRAFGPSGSRPNASEWRQHLIELMPRGKLGLQVCPVSASHMQFAKGCGHCELRKRLGYYPWDLDSFPQIKIDPRSAKPSFAPAPSTAPAPPNVSLGPAAQAPAGAYQMQTAQGPWSTGSSGNSGPQSPQPIQYATTGGSGLGRWLIGGTAVFFAAVILTAIFNSKPATAPTPQSIPSPAPSPPANLTPSPRPPAPPPQPVFSPAQVMQSAGVLGLWAPDCSQPPSPNNNYMQLTLAQNGDVAVTSYQGASQATFIVRKAERIAQDKIGMNFQQTFPPQSFYAEFLIGPGRLQPWFQKMDNGQLVLNNGFNIGSGLQMKWRVRCNLSSPPPPPPQAHFGPIGRPAIIGTPTPIGH